MANPCNIIFIQCDDDRILCQMRYLRATPEFKNGAFK
jgi:hypothetical protein